MFLFPIFSVHFKTRAPGAKTYLQVINARFGKKAHLVFCCFALVTNLVVITGLLLAGKTTMQSVTVNVSEEYTLLVMATLFGSYSLIGGIGTTFYVCYFNLSFTFIVLTVFFTTVLCTNTSAFPNLGDISKMYDIVSCVEGSSDNNLMSFRSAGGIVYGIVGFILACSLTYCNQSAWQNRIAAKPMQGVLGFIFAGLMWIAIPSTLGNTTGLAYLTLSAENRTHLLTAGQIDQGLVSPLIAEKVLGPAGGIMILSMVFMALMSTGSGEVMAVSSILVYDIYQTYIRPFRRSLEQAQCVLCGKASKPDTDTSTNEIDVCQCPIVTSCKQCVEDILRREVNKSTDGSISIYKCPVHGPYRMYQDHLIDFKNWCIIWVAIAIIPVGLMIFSSGIDLNWIFFVGAIVIIPAFPAIILAVMWEKETSEGIITGSISGLLAGIAATLISATRYDGGLSNFVVNTSQEYPILAGSCCSLGVGLIVCIVVSALTHKIKTKADADAEWQKIYDIDNPLNPWEQNYREELKGQHYDKKPSFDQMAAAFRREKNIAYISGGSITVLFTFIIPGIMLSFPVIDETQFKIWIGLTQAWAVLMGIIAIVAPPTEEFLKIQRQRRKNKEHEINLLREYEYSRDCDLST
ncbi:urea active transporter 1 [Mizuhopecten yessoensis]|uniref:Urea active transporter 1 n=2 Tax=Mizuhopecten yessoensis TaxID=6573 RepID=A0A210Q8U1_MIZYE|nr:urea active transporter 1 [Mizuhopecten yessoensis]